MPTRGDSRSNLERTCKTSQKDHIARHAAATEGGKDVGSDPAFRSTHPRQNGTRRADLSSLTGQLSRDNEPPRLAEQRVSRRRKAPVFLSRLDGPAKRVWPMSPDLGRGSRRQ